MFSQKYQNFQNTPLLGFKFGNDHLILPLLPQKYQKFQNTPLLGFKFGSDHLILSLLPQKYQNFQKYLSWDSNLAVTI